MKKYLIFIILFFIDRISKIYLINLQSTGTDVDYYIYPFLNIYLVWNTGIGFGLFSLESNIVYHTVTLIIAIVNIILLVFLIRSKGLNSYLISIILGGSLGNLFDRIYYYAVPDFIDFHIGNFHWFVFNIADIFITVGIIGLIFLEFIKKEKTLTNA
tara:strand:- start:553 stop:1023 length:471 start_codon:yes stop_codon:yes gene_type:complete